MLQDVGGVVIFLEVFSFLLFCGAFGLIAEVANFLRPFIKPAQLQSRLGFIADGVFSSLLHLIGVAGKMLHLVIEIVTQIRPEFVNGGQFLDLVVKAHMRLVGFRGRHVLFLFEGWNILRFHLVFIALGLRLQIGRQKRIGRGNLGWSVARGCGHESLIVLHAEVLFYRVEVVLNDPTVVPDRVLRRNLPVPVFNHAADRDVRQGERFYEVLDPFPFDQRLLKNLAGKSCDLAVRMNGSCFEIGDREPGRQKYFHVCVFDAFLVQDLDAVMKVLVMVYVVNKIGVVKLDGGRAGRPWHFFYL